MKSPRRRPWALVLDFDGTLVTRDVADAVLVRFAKLHEEQIAYSHRTGIVTERWVYAQYRRIREPVAVLRRFALSRARPRRGLGALLRLLRERRIPAEVVSGGLDLYIDPLLARWGAGRLRRSRGTARQTKTGLSVRYRFAGGKLPLPRHKAARVRAHRRKGRRVLYCGDGPSDLLAARSADAVFARGALLRLCRGEGLPAAELKDFLQVVRFLAKEG